jgi:NAD(P)-dependent dehydrogenase (short-subunit alcohol dehydrogenase family)
VWRRAPLLLDDGYRVLLDLGDGIDGFFNNAGIEGTVAPIVSMPVYVATKHGVVGLTKVAALEGAATGIRVNAVCPGPVEGRMMGSLEDGYVAMLGLADAPTAHLAMASTIPGGRYATAEEIARLVAYLLSDNSSYISGAAIPIDWGSTAR